jgi:hypothetical protein
MTIRAVLDFFGGLLLPGQMRMNKQKLSHVFRFTHCGTSPV